MKHAPLWITALLLGAGCVSAPRAPAAPHAPAAPKAPAAPAAVAAPAAPAAPARAAGRPELRYYEISDA